AVIVTNIEPDHLDHYGGFDKLRDAFAQFVREAPGSRALCADDDNTRALADQLPAEGLDVVTYGTHDTADHRIVEVHRSRTGTRLVVAGGGETHPLELPVPGMHNARNAVAAFVMGRLLGAAPDAALRALGRFGGVA